jgi:acyl carrier protein
MSTSAHPEDEVLAGIAAVAREHLGHRGPLALEMRLVEDLELDSIRLLTLATEVENRFRVLLEPADEERIETVGDLVAVVRGKLARVGEASAPGAAT